MSDEAANKPGNDEDDFLTRREKNPEDEDTTSKAEESESSAIDDGDDGDWKTNLGKKQQSILGRRKKQAIAGSAIASILIGVSMFISSILSGPANLIQFGSLLEKHFGNNDKVSDSRVGKLIQNARNRAKNTNERNNMGYWGNKVADHYQKKLVSQGVTPNYNRAGRIDSISIDTSSPEGRKAAVDMAASGFELPDPPEGSTVTTIDLAGTNARNRRQAISAMVGALDINGVSTTVASRTLKVRAAVDFHPLKNVARKADEDIKVFYDKKKQEWAEKIREGSQTDTRLGENGRQEDPDNPANPDDANAANEIDQGIGEIESTATDPDAPTKAKTANIRGKIGAGVGATAIVGTICGLDALGDASAELQETNVTLPLIRMGMDYVSTKSQIQSGEDTNMDEVGAVADSLYDEETKTSVYDADSVQSELGNPNTGREMPGSAKPGKDKPGFFNVVSTLATPFPCSVINSTLGGIALTVGGIALTATGPAAALVTGAGEVIQDRILAAFMDDVVRWIAGDPLDPAGAAGATLGNMANHGAFLAANNTAKTMGGNFMTPQQVVMNKQDDLLINKQKMKNQSFYARMFDVSNPDSLVATTMLRNPSLADPEGTLTTIATAPFKSFSSLQSVFSGILPGAGAVTTPYDYGVDQIGYGLDEVENPRYDDPFENAERIEDEEGKLGRLNQEYGTKCFGTTVDPATGSVKYTKAPSYAELERNRAFCNDDSNQELMDYRIYLADKTALAGMLCYEGLDDQSCADAGLEGTPTTPSSTPTGLATIEKYEPALTTSGQKITPKGITLHWWGGRGGIDSLVSTLRSRNLGVQFGITADGKIYQLTPSEDDLVGHASGANSTTFGIEIEGTPEDFGASGPTSNPAKFNATVQLVRYLSDKYNISKEAILPLDLVCGDIVGIHPHKAYNKCGNTKIDIDDAYFNAVMAEVRK